MNTTNATECTAFDTVRLLVNIFPVLANATPIAEEWWPIGNCNPYSKIVGNHPPCFDFIVVGAGSAGCAIAARLSEVPYWNILLLEAGGEQPAFTKIPGTTPYLYNELYDWGYQSTPDHFSCKALKDERCWVPRGKMMGGSSSINYMHYLRGFKHDYDVWKEMGNEGWGYDDVLPYFKKSEANRDDDIYHQYPGYHGRDGPMSVMRFPYTDPNLRLLIDAWKELGARETDFNAANEYGVMHSQATSSFGERVSSNDAFVAPVRAIRKNLYISTKSYATKLLLKKHNGELRAFGVEYSRENQSRTAMATREVILSAGVFNSPKLMMLSGIGPGAHLRELKIPVLKDLPGVGQNMQDHVILGTIQASINGTDVNTCAEVAEDVKLYERKRLGPLSSTGIIELSSYFHTKGGLTNDVVPDINSGTGPSTMPLVENGTYDPLAKLMSLGPNYNAISVGLVLPYPRSRGYMLLDKNDPVWNQPAIHLNYYNDESDLNTIVLGAQILVNNLFRTKAMRKLGAKLIDVPVVACRDHAFASTAYWRCVALQYTFSNAHQVGTCKMGPPDDADAVVDSRLRVYGVDRLRVVDASIMPRIVGGHMNAPVIMIEAADNVESPSKKLKNWLDRRPKPIA